MRVSSPRTSFRGSGGTITRPSYATFQNVLATPTTPRLITHAQKARRCKKMAAAGGFSQPPPRPPDGRLHVMISHYCAMASMCPCRDPLHNRLNLILHVHHIATYMYHRSYRLCNGVSEIYACTYCLALCLVCQLSHFITSIFLVFRCGAEEYYRQTGKLCGSQRARV